MRILHLPYGFFPDVIGGTEVYVHSLARALQGMGIESLVAAPGTADSAYSYEAIPVRRFVMPEAADLRELYGEGSPAVTATFAAILDEEQPDIVHFHAFTRGVSLAMAYAAKARGLPLILTYHTPAVSCQRGTLLRWGEVVCDGRLDRALCTACALQGQGAPQAAARMLSWTPPVLGKALGRAGLRGGAWTALRMSELVHLRHEAVHAYWTLADRIVVLCDWVGDILERNGVPQKKLFLCRHGLAQRMPPRSKAPTSRTATDLLRLAFLGRMEPVKGADLMIEALKRLPEANLSLDLYGISQGDDSRAYQAALQTAASGDVRVRFLPPLPGEAVIERLQTYDALVVPSQWLETGPLVVLEAFAAGVPVVGSNLGGIAEWVVHEKNGLLVTPFDEVEAWTGALHRLSTDNGLLPRLAQGVLPPRTMFTVAQEMLALYQTLA